MKAKLRIFGSLAVILSSPCAAPAADLGDVNGDGRVSYADAVWYARWVASSDPVFEPAAGSDAFEEAFPCTATGSPGGLIFLEAIRRVSASPLPHFLETWPAPAGPQALPPPPDSRVLVEVLPIVHSDSESEIMLQVRVTSFVPLAGLQLVFKARGVELRPPLEYDSQALFTTTSECFLLSGGELLVYRMLRHDRVLEIGEHELSLPALLVRGTVPGNYPLELVAGTEGVVEGTGDVLVPTATPGEIDVAREVEDGPVLPFPPLVFDEAGRQVLGLTELRLTEAEGSPGDEVSIRVQLRSERPVNRLTFSVMYDGWALKCTGIIPAYADPQDGIVLLNDYRQYFFFNSSPFSGEHSGVLGVRYSSGREYHMYENPQLSGSQPLSFRYLAPLGEWVDIVDLRFTIREGAAGKGSTPVLFPKGTQYPEPHVSVFTPYADRMGSSPGLWGDGHPCSSQAKWWKLDAETIPGQVKILGGGEPREPAPPLTREEAGIRYTLGDASGRPGDTVELPLRVAADVDIWFLWVLLGYDPARLELVGFEVDHVDPDGIPGEARITPAEPYFGAPESCERDQNGHLFGCRSGYPRSANLYGSWQGDSAPEGTLILHVHKLGGVTNPEDFTEEHLLWPHGRTHEAGRAVFRIREDAAPGVVEVSDADVEWQILQFAVPIRLSSGAKPFSIFDPALRDSIERYDVPALSVVPGHIRILGDLPFLRGDANQDGKLDLSDAVHTLGTLFLGAGALLCPDAADANDDGGVNITDPVYSLDHLFRGGPALPVPYPEPGADPTGDELPCEG